MEFTELMESIRSEEATPAWVDHGLTNYRPFVRSNSPRYKQSLLEAAAFIADVYRGRRRPHQLVEALQTTSDFPLLFGDILDRQLIGNYRLAPQNFRTIAKIGTLRDFRTAKRFMINGAQAALTEPIPEAAEYPQVATTEDSYTISLQKFGRATIPFSIEAMINDDLDALTDMPTRLANGVAQGQSKFWVSLFSSASGFNTTYFSNTNKNVLNTTNYPQAIDDNPPLSIQALQDAFTLLSYQRDSDGNPIMIDMVYLVVPPALEVVARNILNATQLWLGGFGQATTTPMGKAGAQDVVMNVANWMRNRLTLVVEPWLPIVNTSGSGGVNGNTTWYLFAGSGAGRGRPSMEISFLRGREEPELFMRRPDAVRVGGGEAGMMAGSFNNDAVAEFKIRSFWGGTLGDPKLAIVSRGDGNS